MIHILGICIHMKRKIFWEILYFFITQTKVYLEKTLIYFYMIEALGCFLNTIRISYLFSILNFPKCQCGHKSFSMLPFLHPTVTSRVIPFTHNINKAQKIATFLIARNQILSYRSNVLLLCLLSTSTLLQNRYSTIYIQTTIFTTHSVFFEE